MSPRLKAAIAQDIDPPVSLREPTVQSAPFVLSSPHSGSVYPASFLAASRLDARRLRKSEDCFVDELFAGVADYGAPMLAARFPRAYLDVNREPYELDPGLFRDRLPDYANTQSLRVAGGFGTIARVVSEAEEIYREPLSVAEALARIDALYVPYHATLKRLIERTRARFGFAVLIDCHSMPSAHSAATRGGRPDIVIGDRFGAAADARLVDAVRRSLHGAGFETVMNRPYAGGFITEHYGRPGVGIHAIQIEINRALYMNEETLLRSSGFEPVRRRLMDAMSDVMQVYASLGRHGMAAE